MDYFYSAFHRMTVNVRDKLLILLLSSFCYQDDCNDRLNKNDVNLSKIFLILCTIPPDVVSMSVDLPVKYPVFPNI